MLLIHASDAVMVLHVTRDGKGKRQIMAIYLQGGSALEIASTNLIATLSPGMGGRLLELRTGGGINVIVPTSPHSFEATAWPKAGAYPLIPYHNRISEACILVEGASVALAPHPHAEPHTLHGPGHTRPWMLESHQRSSLSMVLDYKADEHWPWDFHAKQSYELNDVELTLSLSLVNRGEDPMPAGLGWHPYFKSSAPVSTDAQHAWPHRSDYLPTGERVGVVEENVECEAPTRYLEGWTYARVDLSDGGRAIVSASSDFGFLVVHRGDPAHICVEPATHTPNAWNLPRDRTAVGAWILSPGETLSGIIRLRIEV